MTPQIEPVWPWSLLYAGLSTAPASVVAAVLSAGLLAFAYPILLDRYPSPWQRRRLTLGVGLILVGLLAWVAVGHAWEAPAETTAAGGATLARLTGAALALLFVAPMALAGFTARTYLAANTSPRRIAVILTLRGAAFLLAVLAILRPSLARPRDAAAGGQVLVIAVDASKSMTIQDENSQARWDYLLQTLRDAGPALDRLRREQNVQVEFVRFADKVEPFNLDNPGQPDGKRTDVGAMLHALYDQYGGRRLRGLLVLSDGRANGAQRIDPMTEARRFRRLHCPIHTFAYGSPNTPNGQRDIAVTGVTASPPTVPIKNKITVRATIDAPGFENSAVRVRLFLDDKEQNSQDAVLKLTHGNQVVLQCDAPDKPGEVKVVVRVESPDGQPALPGELNKDNNQLGTFVTVVKGGVNVLLIDKARAWEPQLIYDALAADPRIQVKPLWLRSNAPVDPNAGKLFDFDAQKYDVIIIGDVTAAQMKAIQPDVLGQIQRRVQERTGFLMIGGYSSFGEGDWKDTPIEPMLPVDLNVRGQVQSRNLYGLVMLPTEDGLRLYNHVVGLGGGDAAAQTAAWKEMQKPFGLQGANRIAPLANSNAVVLAQSEEADPKTGQPDPLLVSRDYGGGRVLAFAGDTTYRWVRNADSKRKHDRFWRQMVLWLARQDEGDSQVLVTPDVRSLSVGDDLGFSLGMRSKNGLEVKDGAYTVTVEGPNGESTPVAPTRDGGEDRGVYRPAAAGEYTIRAHGAGKDSDGQEVSGEASARFLVYETDVEMAEWAADEKFLQKLADEGRGEFRRGAKLASFLEQLPAPPAAKTRPKVDLAPDWTSASWSPFFVLFFVLFTGLLAAEWLLRRRWGLV